MLQITGHSLVHTTVNMLIVVSEKHGFHVKQERLLLTK